MSMKINYGNAHGSFPVDEPHLMEIGPMSVTCIYRTEKYLKSKEFNDDPESFLGGIHFDCLIVFHFDELYDVNYLILNTYDTNIVIQISPSTKGYLLSISDQFKNARFQPADLGDDDKLAELLSADKNSLNFEGVNHMVKSYNDAAKDFCQPIFAPDEGMTYSSYMNLSLTTLATSFYFEQEELQQTQFLPNRAKYFEIYPDFSKNCVFAKNNEPLKENFIEDACFNPKSAFHFTESGNFIVCCSNYTILLEYPNTEELNQLLYHLQDCQLFPVTNADEEILTNKYVMDMRHFPSHEEQEEIRAELESVCNEHFGDGVVEPRVAIMSNERFLALTYKTILAYDVFSKYETHAPAGQQVSLESIPSKAFQALMGDQESQQKESSSDANLEPKSLVEDNFDIHSVMKRNRIEDIEILPGFVLSCLFSTSNDNTFRRFIQELGCDQNVTVHFMTNQSNEIFIAFCTVNHLLLLPKTSSLIQVNEILFQIQNSVVYCLDPEDRTSLFQYYKFDILRLFASRSQVEDLLEKVHSPENRDFENYAFELEEKNGELTYSGFFYLTEEVMKSYYDLSPSFSDLEIEPLSDELGSSEQPGPSEQRQLDQDGEKGPLEKIIQPRSFFENEQSQVNEPSQLEGVSQINEREPETTSDMCDRIDSYEWRDFNFTNREVFLNAPDFDIHDKLNFNEVVDVKIDQNDGCGFIRCVLSTTEPPELENYTHILRTGKYATINFTSSPSGSVNFFSLCTGRDMIAVVNPTYEHINSVVRQLNSNFVIPCNVSDFDHLEGFSDASHFRRIATRDLVHGFEERINDEVARRGISFEYESESTYSKFLNVTYRTYLGFLLASRQDESDHISELTQPATQYSYIREPCSLFDSSLDLHREFNVNTAREIELAPHCFVNCVMSATEDIVLNQYLSLLKINQAVSVHFSSSPSHNLNYFTFCTGRDLVVILNPTAKQMTLIIKKLSSSKCHIIPCCLCDRNRLFFYDYLNKVSDSKIIPKSELATVQDEINKCASSLYPRGFNYEIPLSYEKFLHIAYKTFVGHFVRNGYMRNVEPAWFYPLPAYRSNNFINLRDLSETETLTINKENGRLYVVKEISDNRQFKHTYYSFSSKPQRSSLISPCYGSIKSKRPTDKKLVFAFGSRGTLREVIQSNYLDVEKKTRITIELIYALAYLHMTGHYPCNISIDNVAVNWNYHIMLTNFYEYQTATGISPEEHDIQCLAEIIRTLALGIEPENEEEGHDESIPSHLSTISQIYDLTQKEGTTVSQLVSAILSYDLQPKDRKLVERLNSELPQFGHYIHVFPPGFPRPHHPLPPPALPPTDKSIHPPDELNTFPAPPPFPMPFHGHPPPPPGAHHGHHPPPPPPFKGELPPFVGPPFQGPPPKGHKPFHGRCPFAGPRSNGSNVRYFKVDCSANDGELDAQTLNKINVLSFGRETAFHFITDEETGDRSFVYASQDVCGIFEHVTQKVLNIIIPKMGKVLVIPVCDDDLDKLFECFSLDLLKKICMKPELTEVREKARDVEAKMCDFEDKELTASTIAASLALRTPPAGPPPPPPFADESLRNPEFKIHQEKIEPNAVRTIEVFPYYTVNCLYSTEDDETFNDFINSFSPNSVTVNHFVSDESFNQRFVSFINNYNLLLLPESNVIQVNKAIECVKNSKVYCIEEEDRTSLFKYFKFDLIGEFALEDELSPLRERTNEASNVIFTPNVTIDPPTEDENDINVSTFFGLNRDPVAAYYAINNPNVHSFDELSYQTFTGVDRSTDAKKRFRKYMKAVEKNNDPAALYNLGLMYARGVENAVEQDKEKAAEFYEKAAEQGNDKAQFNLALMYAKGEGVPQDKEKAAELYEKAAEQGNPKAQSNLALMYTRGDGVEKNYQRAIELFNQSAEQGDAEAQFNLGLLYNNGEGVPKDKKKAIELFKDAAEKGNNKAQFNLGVMYHNGVDNILPKDDEKAIEYYAMAAAKGNPEAQFNLGVIYSKGYPDKVPQNKQKAAQLFTMAADQGDVDALLNLGTMYSKGEGVPLDKSKTVELYEKAAQKNNPKAQFNLGVMYSKGDGVEQDKEKAAQYYENAANQGVQQAKFNLGVMCFKGDGIEEDKERAAQLFEESANEGNAKAAFNLAVMYQKGDGVEQDSKKAVALYEKAAKKNNRDALLNLGAIYNDGLDDIQDDIDKAVNYFSRAADLGSTKAQLILGQMYLNGDQIDEDLNKAENLLHKASQHHCDEAFLSLGDLYAKQGENDKAIPCYRRAAEAGVPGAAERLQKMGVAECGNEDEQTLEQLCENDGKGSEKLQKLFDSLEERIKVLGNTANDKPTEEEENGENVISRTLGDVNGFLVGHQEHETKKALTDSIKTYENANSMIKSAVNEVGAFIELEKTKNSEKIEEEEEVLSSTGSRSKLPSLHGSRKSSRPPSAISSNASRPVTDDEELSILRLDCQRLESQIEQVERQLESAARYSSGAQASASAQLSSAAAQLSSGTGRNETNLRPSQSSPRRRPILTPRDPDSSGQQSASRKLSSPRTMRNKIRSLQRKADEGDVDAICSLGACYNLGEGVETNKEKAFEYYLKAAELGNADAIYQVGVCYSYGKGTDVDKEKAFDYLMRAAELGNPKAQFAIGHFYEYGNNDYNSDHEKAKEWYKKAADQGHAGAKTALENFSSEATLKEIGSDEQ